MVGDAAFDPSRTVVFSGASGQHGTTAREKAWLDARFSGAAVRGYAGFAGHLLESHFPLGVALAALTLSGRSRVPAFDVAHEAAMSAPADRAVVTTIGHARGEGIAILSAQV